MKYVPSTLVQTMSGSQGDSTFSTGRGGDYIRQRVNPAQPNTARQQAARTAFSAGSSAWRTLTQAQRNGWNNLAQTITLTDRYGKMYKPTGQQLFVANRAASAAIGNNPLSDAPGIVDAPGNLGNITLIIKRGATAATDVFTLQAQFGTDTGDKVVIAATGMYSAGRSYISPGQFKRLAVLTGDNMDNPNSIKNEWEALFGRPIVGTKVSVKVSAFSQNSFPGSPIIVTTVVVPV